MKFRIAENYNKLNLQMICNKNLDATFHDFTTFALPFFIFIHEQILSFLVNPTQNTRFLTHLFLKNKLLLVTFLCRISHFILVHVSKSL